MVLDIIKNTKIVIAPMAGISDPPFRQLCRDFGAKLCYSEMISAIGVTNNDKKSKTFTIKNNEFPLAAQIFGSNPDSMAYAAEYFQEQKVAMIDINLGCPVKKVAKQNAGASLARNLNLTEKIIKAVRKKIHIPLSIKFRLGWNQNEENYLDLCKIAENNGVDVVCLHPRYAVQLYSGHADWKKINNLRKFFSGIIVGSGDIKTKEDIHYKISNYDIDAVMLGRGVIGNPWLISDYLEKEKKSIPETILLHFSYLSDFHGEKKAATLFRKFIGKYVRGQTNAQELRVFGNNVNNFENIKKLITMIGNK